MPSYTRGVKRDKTSFVLLNPVFCYGWKTVDLASITGITTADVAALGHMDSVSANAVASRIMVMGANSPKPGRVVRRMANASVTQRASVSTYVSYLARAAAVAAGWTLSTPQKGVRLVAPNPNRRSITAVAELSDGTRYVFPLNQADFELVGTAFGLKNSTQITTPQERQKLASGMTSTRPGKAALENITNTLTTFYSTDNKDEIAAAGYTIVSEEEIAFPLAPVPAP